MSIGSDAQKCALPIKYPLEYTPAPTKNILSPLVSTMTANIKKTIKQYVVTTVVSPTSSNSKRCKEVPKWCVSQSLLRKVVWRINRICCGGEKSKGGRSNTNIIIISNWDIVGHYQGMKGWGWKSQPKEVMILPVHTVSTLPYQTYGQTDVRTNRASRGDRPMLDALII